jgi:Gas vesicle synthesis protein GvpL/GvpF
VAQPSLSSLRLYGVGAVDTAHPASLAEGTELVNYRALSAIVESSAYDAVGLDDAEVDKYLRIVDEAHAHTAILPAPPGTVFRSKATLTQWLELHYFTLTEALSMVEGHASARVSISTEGARAEGEANKSFAALAAESIRLLRSHSAATVTLPSGDGDEEAGVITRASFLVDTERWKAFEEAVASEGKRQKALAFKVTGPWPPYDFVRMQFGA